VTDLYGTESGGETWQRLLDVDSPGYRFQSLLVLPSSPETVFAGHAVNGVYLTTDGGQTWETANEGLTNTSVHALAVSTSVPTTVYAATGHGEVFTYEVTAADQS
jgi:photosystem II stability/assembly factor-like uncharacterized protein